MAVQLPDQHFKQALICLIALTLVVLSNTSHVEIASSARRTFIMLLMIRSIWRLILEHIGCFYVQCLFIAIAGALSASNTPCS